jgi:hypothetical protein
MDASVMSVQAMSMLDDGSTMVQIGNDLQDRAAVVGWDVIRGLYGQNEAGMEAVRELLGPNADPVPAARNPAETLSLAANLPAGGVCFFCNAHRDIFEEADALGGLLPGEGCVAEGRRRDGMKYHGCKRHSPASIIWCVWSCTHQPGANTSLWSGSAFWMRCGGSAPRAPGSP